MISSSTEEVKHGYTANSTTNDTNADVVTKSMLKRGNAVPVRRDRCSVATARYTVILKWNCPVVFEGQTRADRLAGYA